MIDCTKYFGGFLVVGAVGQKRTVWLVITAGLVLFTIWMIFEWIEILAAFDLVFIVAALLTFQFLLED